MVEMLAKEGNMKVPVAMFITDKVQPSTETFERLRDLASIEGVSENIVALPDIHFKHSNSAPTGIVVVSEHFIIPKIISTDCGMCLFTTNLTTKDVTPQLLDTLFGAFQKSISVNIRKKPIISAEALDALLLEGPSYLYKKFSMDTKELQNIEYEGNLLKGFNISIEELRNLLPKEAFVLGRNSLGILGTGNHFLELQSVVEEPDPALAKIFGLKKNQLVFMLHCDSSGFGNAIHDYYKEYKNGKFGMSLKRNLLYKAYLNFGKIPGGKTFLYHMNIQRKHLKEHLSWKQGSAKQNFVTVPIESEAGQEYLKTKYVAMMYGFSNRAYVRKLVQDCLTKTFSKKIETHLLVDSTHDSFYYEEIKGKMLCVHRNGANRVLPKTLFKKHPLFSKTGQPLLVPGSMGSASYFCVPLKGVESTFYSVYHGAGRVLEKAEARDTISMKKFQEEMQHVRLYRYGVGDIVEEAPSSFKDVTAVLEAMEYHQLAKPVVKLKPLAFLKGS